MIYYALLEFLELCPCTEASLFCSIYLLSLPIWSCWDHNSAWALHGLRAIVKFPWVCLSAFQCALTVMAIVLCSTLQKRSVHPRFGLLLRKIMMYFLLVGIVKWFAFTEHKKGILTDVLLMYWIQRIHFRSSKEIYSLYWYNYRTEHRIYGFCTSFCISYISRKLILNFKLGTIHVYFLLCTWVTLLWFSLKCECTMWYSY